MAQGFKVQGKVHATLEAAKEHANRIHRRTGVFVEIREVKRRGSRKAARNCGGRKHYFTRNPRRRSRRVQKGWWGMSKGLLGTLALLGIGYMLLKNQGPVVTPAPIPPTPAPPEGTVYAGGQMQGLGCAACAAASLPGMNGMGTLYSEDSYSGPYGEENIGGAGVSPYYGPDGLFADLYPRNAGLPH